MRGDTRPAPRRALNSPSFAAAAGTIGSSRGAYHRPERHSTTRPNNCLCLNRRHSNVVYGRVQASVQFPNSGTAVGGGPTRVVTLPVRTSFLIFDGPAPAR